MGLEVTQRQFLILSEMTSKGYLLCCGAQVQDYNVPFKCKHTFSSWSKELQ